MKTIPAGTGEKMQYLVHDFNDNTIRFVLSYPAVLDADALCRAVRHVAMSSDILHASFDPGRLHACWHVHDQLEDADCFEAFRTDSDPVEKALALSLSPVLHAGRAQLLCSLVTGRESSAVAVRISHLCVDGSDAKYLLTRLAQAYTLVRTSGSCEGLAIKSGDRSPEQLYQGLDRDSLRSLMRNPATGIKSPYPYPTQEYGELRMAHRIIPASVMAQARTRAKKAGATANDLLLAACYAAYAGCPGVDASAALSVMGMMDLRRHCPGGDSSGLSNMSGALPTSLPDGLPQNFDALLADIACQTQQVKNDPLAGLVGLPLIHKAARSIPLTMLTKLAGRLYGSVGIGLTNLGSMDGAQLALDDLRPTLCLFGGPLKNKPHMQISAVSLDGECALSVAGRYAQKDEQSLLAMLDRMADAVSAYAS